MKKLMTGVAQNLSRGADHATLVLPWSLLVMSIAWFNDRPFLFWATTFLVSLMAIGMVCRQVQK